MNLLTHVKQLVAEERRITAALIPALLEVKRTMLFAELGYPNLFAFLTRELGYSESAAYRRLSAMRLHEQNSQVAPKIESGELSLTNAAMLGSQLREAAKQGVDLPPAAKEEMFQAALGASTREAEQKMGAIGERHGVRPKKPTDHLLREKIEKVKAKLSHAHPGLTDNELFHLLLDKELAGSKPHGNTGRGKSESETRHIPAKLKRRIFERDGGECTFADPKTGRRCGATHFVQVHHIVPVAHGGLTKESNLTLHCQAHNKLEAQREGLAR